MFLKYLEPIFKPWRAMRNKVVKVKTVKGNITSEGRRVQRFGRLAKSQKQRVAKATGRVQTDVPRAGDMPTAAPAAAPAAIPSPGPPPGAVPQGMTLQATAGGAPMSFPAGPHGDHVHGPVHNPPIKIKGFWFWKRKLCTQCYARLLMDWDCCPYCLQNYAPKPAAPAPPPGAATPDGRWLLGWLVPLDGVQRGELFTLAPKTIIGNDPSCTIILHTDYVSKRHAEVAARNGYWVITDLGSANGTMVNDKPITQHELIDNDFIGIGGCTMRFKCIYEAPPTPVNVY